MNESKEPQPRLSMLTAEGDGACGSDGCMIPSGHLAKAAEPQADEKL